MITSDLGFVAFKAWKERFRISEVEWTTLSYAERYSWQLVGRAVRDRVIDECCAGLAERLKETLLAEE